MRRASSIATGSYAHTDAPRSSSALITTRLGASHVENVSGGEEGLKAQAASRPYDVAFEVSGTAAGLASAIGIVRRGGTVVQIGNLPGGPLAAIKSGRLRGVGITTATRSPRAPEVPTFAEGGVPGYDVSSWYGICGPAGLPKAVHAKLNAGLVKVLIAPELRQRMEDQGIDVKPSTSAEFLAFVKNETAKWTKVVKEAGLKGD